MVNHHNKRFKDNFQQHTQHQQNHHSGLISDHIGARDGESDLIDELHFNGSDGGDQINNNSNNDNSSNDIPRCIRHSNDTNNNSLNNTTSSRSTDSINGKSTCVF